ncbi:tRNA (adenosine(37)-N6)-threonylcarbamoyltransferase complex ATPase subunit type 1 TsaE [Candidatus Berkelbacteria bacterium]|nr:tRNA (adenosine(37)-N6)-threonylcarbamoyltransferase complex ATPase subunit type 1 TsaE [Candidatus Berkelbacteria bacterium]
MKRVFPIQTLNELTAVAHELAKNLKPGLIVGLVGFLGTGKTTFVRHLLLDLGLQAEVISPTFVYEQIYKLPQAVRGIKRLHHLDLYRLTRKQDFEALGLTLENPEGATLVEWIDNLPEIIEQAHYLLYFSFSRQGKRCVKIEVRK